MITVSGKFDAIGKSSDILLNPGAELEVRLSVASTEEFEGLVKLEYSDNNGKRFKEYTRETDVDDSYADVIKYVNNELKPQYVRLVCYEFASTSDEVNYTIIDKQDAVKKDAKFIQGEVLSDGGQPLFRVKETGVEFVFLGEAGEATGDVGVSNSPGAVKTVLKLNRFPVPVKSVGNGDGEGGVSIYKFPKGFISHLGSSANLKLEVLAGEADDFEDDEATGTIAIATDDDVANDAFAGADTFAMTANVADVELAPEAIAQVDGSTTAVEAFVAIVVDAASIKDDTETVVHVSGEVIINWVKI